MNTMTLLGTLTYTDAGDMDGFHVARGGSTGEPGG